MAGAGRHGLGRSCIVSHLLLVVLVVFVIGEVEVRLIDTNGQPPVAARRARG